MNFNSQPTLEGHEAYSSKIDIRFFRHDQKETDKTKSDLEIELTPDGRKHAKSLAEDTNLAQSVAFGSPRKRTQETAGFVMAGSQEDITGNESFTELKAKIDKDVGFGSKIGVDPRLNFELEGDTEYVKEAVKAFKDGILMRFLIEKSDERAKETGDDVSSTYSKMAASVASIIQKYVGIAPRWDELVTDETKKYEPVMRRFMGTHQSIQECFLAKVIELTKGMEEREHFLNTVGSAGFSFGEGFKAEVITKEPGSAPLVHISYKGIHPTTLEHYVIEQDVPMEVIEQIVQG